MPKLTDYIDAGRLQRLQDDFVAAVPVRLRILDADGAALTKESAAGLAGRPAAPSEALTEGIAGEATIVVDDQVVGKVVYTSGGPAIAGVDGLNLCKLVAGILSRQCQRRDEYASRMEELATMYRLTAEFTGQRNLQVVLDLVAKTVVDVMKAKACSIRLLSEDRNELVIKAVHNLSREYLSKGPILVSDSKIDKEILQNFKTIYIADERTDPRVLYPQEARREGIVSALCAPMVYKGRPEGVIRVYTAEPHEFDGFEISLLETIAGQAAAAIVNARLYAEAVSAANIRRQLRLAAEVQRRMIPASPPSVPGLQIAAMYVPCFELGGDFYDFIALPQENWGLSVCDVVGKGVRSSLLMASIRASLRAHALNVYQLSEVLAKVNRDLCSDTLVSDFATMFYGVIDAKARRLTYANAGHVPPILFRSGQAQLLDPTGGVLGLDPAARWTYQVLTLQAGDVILFYTDGLTEALNFEDEAFGRQRTQQAAMAAVNEGQAAEGIVRHVLWTMRRFAGLQSRLDDLTLIAIKVL